MEEKGRILVVEDNPDDAIIMELGLRERGWAAEFVNNGADAVARLANENFDAVVLDYRLNDMTGTEVLLKLREKDAQIPVVMASGADSHFIVARSLALGASDFVNKDEQDFAESLSVALGKAVGQAHKAREGTVPRTVKERAREVKQILTTFLEASGVVATVGIVSPEGALIHSTIHDQSGAQDVTAVLASTAQTMLATVAGHLGYGPTKSFVATFRDGALAVAPLPGGLVLYVTTNAAPDISNRLRKEVEAVALELSQVLRAPE